VLVVWLAAGRTLGDDPRWPDLLAELRRRFTPLANLSLVILIVIGLFQTGGDPNYGGLLVFDNGWSQAILLKHIAIAGMVVAGALLQFGVAPAQERLAILRLRGKADPAESARLLRRERQLNTLNLAPGALVLAFTAVATAL